jgi:hypothetical protein
MHLTSPTALCTDQGDPQRVDRPTPMAARSSAHAVGSPGTRLQTLRLGLGKVAAVLAFTVAAGCGGGGSGGPAAGSPSTPGGGTASTFAVAGTIERLWGTGGTYTASWRDPANATAPLFEVTVSYTPGADAVFEGSTRRTATQLTTFRVGGVVVGTDITTLYYSNAGSLQLWGSRNLGGPTTVFGQGSVGFPLTGSAGSQGALGASVVWADDSKTQQLYSGSLSWTVEPHDAGTAFVCLNATLTAVSPGTDTTTESTCLRTDAAGQIVGARFSLTTGGETVTFR